MPTFVIHAIGQPSKKISFDKPPVRVGRDPSNHLVLPDQTVSREHAVFQTDLSRRWFVSCVSETNPVVVDGKMVTKRKYIMEGSEILVGKDHLVIFCNNESTAAKHLGAAFVKTKCKMCDWIGMVRSGARNVTCPDCGSTDLLAANVYAKDKEVEKAKEGVTSLMSPSQLAGILGRLKTAKGSRLERADGREPSRKELSESEPAKLSRKEEPALKLFGFILGGGVTVTWDGAQFVAESAMWYPSMKVNGFPVKRSNLRHGDVLRVGSNAFRFLVD